jgi:Flp pilus assembly protein TadG
MSATGERSSAPRGRRVLAWLGRHFKDQRGAVSPILALSLVPIIGALGMGVEGSNWWLTQRAAQNAADTAAIAASQTGNTTCSGTCSATSYSGACSTSSNAADFDCEAAMAASNAGFAIAANSVSVLPQHLTSGCPTGTSDCYQVTIHRTVPLYLLGVVGFRGTSGVTTASGGLAEQVTATAIVGSSVQKFPACLMTNGTGTNVTTHGTPKVFFKGCAIQDNSTSPNAGDCTGQGLFGAASFSSPGGEKHAGNCGSPDLVDTAQPDPYTSLASNIPADPCSSNYPGASISKASFGTALLSSPGVRYVCGNATYTGTALTALTGNTVLVIYNGSLTIPSGQDLTTAAGAGLTIVFSGASTSTDHNLQGAGTLDIAAPDANSGSVWKGIGVYQDARLAGPNAHLNETAAGSSPTLLVSGVVEMPHSSWTISGAINLHTGGLDCFILDVNDLTINGQGAIFDQSQTVNHQSQCSQAGATQVFGQRNVYVLAQ